MTCLVSWIGIDSRGHSSAYIVSESRISWGASKTWDVGRKVFCSRKSPDIWGYCGDVLFPTIVLGQFIEMIDEGIAQTSGDIHQRFVDFFETQMESYPEQEARGFSIIHCHRDNTGIRSVMRAWKLSWSLGDGWVDQEIKVPQQSGAITSLGSGRPFFKNWNHKFQASDVGGTSRAIFQAFCKMLQQNDDPLCGGAPQLVSLIRIGNGRQHGIVWNGEAWLAGMKIASSDCSSGFEFFDELMERVDPQTLKLKDGAQRQPLPSQV